MCSSMELSAVKGCWLDLSWRGWRMKKVGAGGCGMSEEWCQRIYQGVIDLSSQSISKVGKKPDMSSQFVSKAGKQAQSHNPLEFEKQSFT
ncbi:hypothetical protein L6452_40791 [Arctium lappa]|uniref:Uncharacterized protein n=1 Tax=Arctium lappa TaxID=4217 RepID=A0ACB8XNE8_ARCLA|nr:hypothetical protein L6452_40791 [Arctium lappa]